MLNEPIRVGKTTLKNRVVFPPLTTGYEEQDGSIGQRSLNFYRRVAQGGAGYIVLGDVASLNTASPTPKLASDAQIPSFARLADAVHEFGAKLAIQIFHPEYDVRGVGMRIAQTRLLAQQGKKEESEAATREAYAYLHHSMAHFVDEASHEQLDAIVCSMVSCALRAQKAGVDAIEIHGDRFVGSLCSKLMNHRTDEYGASFEGRTRFALRLVRAIREAVPDLLLDYKLPVMTPMKGGLRGKGGLEPDEAVELAKLMEAAGVDMFHVAQANHTGNMGDTIPYMGTRPYGFAVFAAKAVKEAVSVPVCAVGRIISVSSAESLLESGKCDLVGLGRSLVCDPDYPKKAASGEPIRHCLNCNRGCTDAITDRRFCECVLNAENGSEYERVITRAEKPVLVAVVGGGMAGLEAARVSALKGHRVTLFERGLTLGGQVRLASVPPRKGEMRRSVEYFEKLLPRLGVELVLGREPGKEELNAFDHVIAAVGAKNIVLPVEGADGANVVSAWEVLAGTHTVFGSAAVIGGGLVGVETAAYLAHQGIKVDIVEMKPTIAEGESSTVLPEILSEFAARGVTEYVNTRLERITSRSVVCIDTVSGEEITIPADFVVIAVGAAPAAFDTEGITAQIHYCGDCLVPADISHAIRTAYDTANAIN